RLTSRLAGRAGHLLHCIRLPPRRSTLFPYTTLFRSEAGRHQASAGIEYLVSVLRRHVAHCFDHPANAAHRAPLHPARSDESATRSEEHTSELQSRENLVCRLLLEKKNEHKGSDVSRA